MKYNKSIGVQEQAKRTGKNKLTGKAEIFGIIAGSSGLGFSLIVPLLGGAFLGSYLDRRFNTAPKITLSLILLGLFIGLYSMYRGVLDILKK